MSGGQDILKGIPQEMGTVCLKELNNLLFQTECDHDLRILYKSC